MKTTLRLFVATVAIAMASFTTPPEKVYVCDSKTSVAYHASKDCRGLNKCTHEIIYITKKDAMENYGKRACKICY